MIWRSSFFKAIPLFVLSAPLSFFSPMAMAQDDGVKAIIATQSFLNDIEDGISLNKTYILNVDIQSNAPSRGFRGLLLRLLSTYRYKIGPLQSTSCNLASGYSRPRSSFIPLVFRSPSADQVKLCIVGRVPGYGTQPFSDATSYRWDQSTPGNRSLIVAPVSPSVTSTPTVRWQEVEGARRYDLTVAKNASCTDVVQQYNNLRNNYQTLTPLNDGTYYACVQIEFRGNTTQPALNSGCNWVQTTGQGGNPPGVFSILAPVSPSVTATPTVIWQPSAGASSYDLSIAHDLNCSDIVQSYPSLSVTSLQITALDDGEYYACVIAKNAFGSLPASNNGFLWTQIATPPSAFSITGPSALSSDPTPLLSWNAADGAQSYHIVISSDENCGQIVQEASDINSTSLELDSLVDGIYYACVEAINAAGSTPASNNAYQWEQLTQPPATFSVLSPQSPSITNVPIVSWQASERAESYDLIISMNVDCSDPIQSFLGINVTSQQLSPLVDASYYACVIARNQIGETQASIGWTQITQVPQAFSMISPSGYIDSETPIVEWENSAGAESYDLTIASDSSCLIPVASYEGILSTSIEISPITEGSYFACVVAKNPAGSTVASNTLNWIYDVTPPESFMISGPVDPSVDGNLVFTWTSAAGADHYRLTLSVTNDCVSDTIVFDNLAATSKATTANVNGIFFACVSAFDEAGNETQASNNPFTYVVNIPPAPPQIMFVTSMLIGIENSLLYPPFPPFISRPEAADYLCTNLASNAGLVSGWNGTDIVYRAFLSSSTQGVINRIPFRNRIEDVHGNLIASSVYDLLDGTLSSPIQYNEKGVLVAATQKVWTGSDQTGERTSNTCQNWDHPGFAGTYGLAGSVNSQWINAGVLSCTAGARMYCISP